MIEVVGVEVVIDDAARSRTDKRIDRDILIEEDGNLTVLLVRIVLADGAFARGRIVRFADTRQQQQTHVVHLVRTQRDDIRGLLDRASLCIDIGDTGGALAGRVEVDLDDRRTVAQFEVGLSRERRQDAGLRRRFRKHVAAEQLAIAAEVAGPKLHAVRVRIRLRRNRRGRRIRVMTEVARGLLEQHRRIGGGQRRQRVVTRARRFERIAAADRLAVEVARLATGARDILEAVIERFKLGGADRPVLNRHVVGNEVLAVALLVVTAQLQVGIGRAIGEAVPVHARAAHAIAEQKCAVLAQRQRGFARMATNRDCLVSEALHQLVALYVGQLVGDLRIREVGIRIAVFAAFETDDGEAGVRQFDRHNRTGPAHADDHRVHFGFNDVRHVSPPGVCFI